MKFALDLTADDSDMVKHTKERRKSHALQSNEDSDVVILRDTADSDVEDISPEEFRRAILAQEAVEERNAKGPVKKSAQQSDGIDDSDRTSSDENAFDGCDTKQDDGVQITASFGKVATRDLPHSRPDCAVHCFTFGVSSSNRRHCAQCYCYVCDVKAAECKFWGTGADSEDHANARPLAKWNLLRKAVREGGAAAAQGGMKTKTGKSGKNRDRGIHRKELQHKKDGGQGNTSPGRKVAPAFVNVSRPSKSAGRPAMRRQAHGRHAWPLAGIPVPVSTLLSSPRSSPLFRGRRMTSPKHLAKLANLVQRTKQSNE